MKKITCMLAGLLLAAGLQAQSQDKAKEQAMKRYFADPLFTQLKPKVTTAEGIKDTDARLLVENLLADAEGYSKFRVAEYEPYMTTGTLRRILKTSAQYNRYENPTGVYLKKGESCIVMAEGIGQDSVGLNIKNWLKSEEASHYSLHNGLNRITATTEGNVFVDYYTDNYQNAPNVKLHFVNAPVRGYWDRETMTNSDWKEMLKAFDKNDSTILITRSRHAQLAFPVCKWIENCPENIDSVMTLYQQVQDGERYMMGLEKYGRQVKNRQLFYATNYGFMAAGGEGAYCHIGSLNDLCTPDAKRFGFWGVGHEWGHNNQIEGFKWSGLGETSNNVYASWVQMIYGGDSTQIKLENERIGVNEYSGMRGGRIEVYFEEGLRKGIPWQLQDGPDYHGSKPETVTVQGQDAEGNNTGEVTTTKRNYDHFVKVIPFHQLNLWGTVAGKSPDIIPMIIESIRSTKGYTRTFNTIGKQQMNWIKLACDSTKLNLLPFFEKAGMLKPMHTYIEDYGRGWSIITPEMINKLKAHVKTQCYKTPDEEINYICAHNAHIYRDNLKLQVPATPNEGCTPEKDKVVVDHNIVKNAVAFETYTADHRLLRITMYGLGSNDAHTITRVLYPAATETSPAAAYIMAVGYDGTRMKIYESGATQETKK